MDASDAQPEASAPDVREASAVDAMDADVSDAGADVMDAAVDATDAAPDVADTGVCDGAQSRCGSVCVDTATDPLNCGACGVACPSTANGAAVCAAGRCDLRCDPGSHRCGNACLRDNDVASCGARCTPCAEPAGSRSTCSMGTCGYACLPGFEDIGGACEVAVARPVFPPGTSTVTMLRPTLKWALPMGVDGAQIELCRDRACTMVIERLNATGASARPTMDLPRSSVVFWRLRGRVGASTGTRVSATWQFRTPARSATTADTAYGTELDVNGDGFTDVAVGVLNANGGRGGVNVYYGSASGPSATPSRQIDRPSVGLGSLFGWGLAPAGDVNGDGFADLVVSERRGSPGGRIDAGAAHVYLGSAAGIASAPSVTIEGVNANDLFGNSVAAAGDVNGDGWADVVVCASLGDAMGFVDVGTCSVFHGGRTTIASSPAAVLPFAFRAAGAGDVNGDRLSDLLLGNPSATIAGRTRAGAAYVLLGNATGITTTPQVALEGTFADDAFGYPAGAGDVNGDGYSDVAVGASGADPGGRMNAGSISLFAGSSTGAASRTTTVLEGLVAGELFGIVLANAGDTNSDGYSDLIVGVSNAASTGRAFVFSGSALGYALAPRTLLGENAGDRFGVSVAGIGDCNGDGSTDVVVGADRASPSGISNAGVASVFQGAAGGISTTALRTLTGANVGDLFGIAVASRRSRPRWACAVGRR
jgi:hypothetical protein